MWIATYFEHDPPLSPRSRNRRLGTTKDAGARPVGHRASGPQPGGGRRAVRGRRGTPRAFPAGEECSIGRRRGPQRNDEAFPRAPTQCRRSDVAKIHHDAASGNETPHRNERSGSAAGATPDRRPLAAFGRTAGQYAPGGAHRRIEEPSPFARRNHGLLETPNRKGAHRNGLGQPRRAVNSVRIPMDSSFDL